MSKLKQSLRTIEIDHKPIGQTVPNQYVFNVFVYNDGTYLLKSDPILFIPAGTGWVSGPIAIEDIPSVVMEQFEAQISPQEKEYY